MRPDEVRPELIAGAVRAFDVRYRDTEIVLWRLSRVAAEHLLAGWSSEVVETLVWTIKSWWRVQGVKTEIKQLSARALTAESWTPPMLALTRELTPAVEAAACERVTRLVDALYVSRGRQEFSLSSKVLHWLLPWHVPVYDSFVRIMLDIPESRQSAAAYEEIVRWEYAAVRHLSGQEAEWIGSLQPVSPFRALDKYLWWEGGGSAEDLGVPRDPYAVLRRLGIEGDSGGA